VQIKASFIQILISTRHGGGSSSKISSSSSSNSSSSSSSSIRLSNPCTNLDRSWEFEEAEVPKFQDNQHMKMVRLSVLSTG
jgi:hypothetical protein